MCQTVKFLSFADENVVSVFGFYEPFELCCAPFFPSGTHGGTNAAVGRDVGLLQSSEGQPSVDYNSRFPSST